MQCDVAITLISDFLFYNQCHCIDKRKTAWFLVTTKKQSTIAFYQTQLLVPRWNKQRSDERFDKTAQRQAQWFQQELLLLKSGHCPALFGNKFILDMS